MKYTGQQIADGAFTKLIDDSGQHQMTWPSANQGELAWRMVHAWKDMSESDYLIAASVIDAYYNLVHSTQAKRNAVCEALKGSV